MANTPSHISAVRAMLPDIFHNYRKNGFHFFIGEFDYGKGKGNEHILVGLPPEEMILEADWKIIRRIEKFEDVPETQYNQLLDHHHNYLELAMEQW